MSEPQRQPAAATRGRRFRWLRYLAALCLIAAMLMAVAWWTGHLQRGLLAMGGRIAGMDITASAVVLSIDAAELSGVAVSVPARDITFEAGRISLEPDWRAVFSQERPPNYRPLTRLEIDNAAIVARMGASQGGGGSPAPGLEEANGLLRLLPRKTVVQDMAVEGSMSGAMVRLPAVDVVVESYDGPGGVPIAELRIFQDTGASESAIITLPGGREVALNQFQLGMAASPETFMDLAFRVDAFDSKLDAEIALRSLQAPLIEGDSFSWNLKIKDAAIAPPRAFQPWIGEIPISWDMLAVEQAALAGTRGAGTLGLREAAIQLEASGLRHAGGPLIAELPIALATGIDDETVTLSVREGTRELLSAEARFASLQNLAEGQASAMASLSEWTFDDVLRWTPPEYRGYAGAFSVLQSLSAELDVRRDGQYTGTADVDLTLGLDNTPVALRLAATADDLAFPFAAEATLEQGEGALSASALFESQEAFTANLRMASFRPRQLLKALAHFPPEVSAIDSSFDGAVEAAIAGGEVSFSTSLSATPPPFIEGAYLADVPLQAEASATYQSETSRLRFSNIALRLGEAVRINSGAFDGDLNGASFNGPVNLSGDLGALAAYFGLGTLTGETRATGQLYITGTEVSGRADAAFDGIGYGYYGLPYGSELRAAGRYRYALDSGRLRFDEVTVSTGEDTPGTILQLPSVSIATTPARAEAEAFTFSSNGLALIEAGLLADVRGSLRGTGHFDYGLNGLDASIALEAALQTLALRNAAAILGGATIEGEAALAGGSLDGWAEANAAEFAAAGVAMNEVHIPALFTGQHIQVRDAEAKLLGGQVRVNARVNLLAGGYPAEVSARLRNIDLAQFTEQFQPPNLVLTGIADGLATAEYADGEVTAFNLTMKVFKGFSINRDMLRQLLLSSEVGEAAGQTVGNIVESVIGDERQRAFDSAEIDATLQEGDIVGTAELESEQLNLTVDLRIDGRHIRELIRLNQLGHLDRMEDFQVEQLPAVE